MNLPTDPRRFLYRGDMLQPQAALRLTADALANCDDGELYLQYTASESFGFDDGRLKTADFNTQAGFGLRGVSGETTAFAHANELSEAAIRRAKGIRRIRRGSAPCRIRCATRCVRVLVLPLPGPASTTQLSVES